MKAIVRDAYGEVDVLRLGEIATPIPGESEVLLRVVAAGVDQGVWHLLTGMPYAMRLAGFGVRAPKNPLLGWDVAGRVEAVGAGVTTLRPGDEVFGTCRGAFAEYVAARADRLVSKPDNVTFEQAAVVPISGYAALQAVREHERFAPGSGCWSSARAEALEPSRCRSRRHMAPRSRASAAPARSNWCAPSEPTT